MLLYLFGDAGVATYIEYDENASETIFNLESLSDGFEAIISPAVGRRMGLDIRKDDDVSLLKMPIEDENGNIHYLSEGYMDGVAVFEFSTCRAAENIKALMDKTGTTANDYSMLCLHQANKQIVQTVGMNVGFELDKVPYNAFERFGNNTMCSIPSVILLNMQDRLKNEKTTLLCSGFGNGLVVCSANLTFDYIKYANIGTYHPDPTHKTNAEWIEYWKKKIANT